MLIRRKADQIGMTGNVGKIHCMAFPGRNLPAFDAEVPHQSKGLVTEKPGIFIKSVSRVIISRTLCSFITAAIRQS